MKIKIKLLIIILIISVVIGFIFSCFLFGEETCFVCMGLGSCYKCFSDKPVDGDVCEVCGGSGICFNCKGSGRIPAKGY